MYVALPLATCDTVRFLEQLVLYYHNTCTTEVCVARQLPELDDTAEGIEDEKEVCVCVCVCVCACVRVCWICVLC